MIYYILRFILILSLFFNVPITAAIDFKIDPISWSHHDSKGYNFTNLTPYFYPIKISIISTETDPYYYFFTFSANKTNNQFDNIIIDGNYDELLDESINILPSRYAKNNGSKLSYQFYQQPNTMVPLSEHIKNDFSMIRKHITYGNNTTLNETFYMSVQPNQYVAPGIYKDLAIISLYQGPTEFLSEATLIARKKVPISITVQEVSDITVFDNDKNLTFYDTNLKKNNSVTVKYKFISNQNASLWLESNIGSLSLSENTVIYNPYDKTSASKPIWIKNASDQTLHSLTIAIPNELYESNLSNTANITTQVIKNPSQNITNKIIFDDGPSEIEFKSSLLFNDILNFIIKVD